MSEVFPLIAGMLVGLVIQRINGSRLKSAALVLLAVFVGTAAAYISGELFVSWAYLIFDVVQVLLAAIVAIVMSRWLLRRAL